MQLAPSAAIIRPVSSDFPLASAEDLQPRSIKDEMFDALDRMRGKPDVEVAGAFAKQRIVRGRQVNIEELEDRAGQPLRLTKGEMEDFAQEERRLYSEIGVLERSAETSWLGCAKRPVNGGLNNPDRKASTFGES